MAEIDRVAAMRQRFEKFLRIDIVAMRNGIRKPVLHLGDQLGNVRLAEGRNPLPPGCMKAQTCGRRSACGSTCRMKTPRP